MSMTHEPTIRHPGEGRTIADVGGSVASPVASSESLTIRGEDIQHFTGVPLGLVSELYETSLDIPCFPSANQQIVPR